MIKAIGAVVCGMAVLGGEASAQAPARAWTDRGFVNVSGGTQAGSEDVSQTLSFPLYDETATVIVAHTNKPGAFFDITGAKRLKGNLGVGLSFTRSSSSSDGAVTGTIPSPIKFDTPRTVTDTVTGLTYTVSWIGILGVYAIPLTDKVDVFVLGGPAVARVSEDGITAATVTETENVSAPVVTTTRGTLTHSYWGFEAGADVRYMITKQIGVGAFARYNHSTGTSTDAGKFNGNSFHIAGGVRVRF